MPGILKFVIGDRSAVTFTVLWQMIHGWASFLYITDGYKVYPCLIDDCVRVSGAEHHHLVSTRSDDQSRRRKLPSETLSS